MSQGELGTRPPGPITIDQLVALNDEIAALVRAGIPLERGLQAAGRDLRGRLGRVASALGQRLSRGESLSDALESERRSVPPLYRAVVQAGARSGRLAVALEGLADYVRGYSEARSAIGLALWYPLLVLILAYVLFLGLVSLAVPRYVAAFQSLGVKVPRVLEWLSKAGEMAHYWWPVGPVLLLVLLVAWIRSGSAARFQSASWAWLRIFPWMTSILANYETASFCQLLSLLLEHNVAYPTALVLAAESTGNRKLTDGARLLADGITRGEPAAKILGKLDDRAFLPMLRWVLAVGQEQGSLVTSLRNLAKTYRNRGKFQADKLSVFLPVILMLVIGASAALLYGLALFIPLVDLLRGLTAA
jgi:general secretion pathway protein F